MPDTQVEASDTGWSTLPTTSTQQVVVTTDHERLVAQQIERLRGVTLKDPKRSPGLDLVLLDVPGLPEVEQPGEDALGDLLKELYGYFRREYHWVPTVGRNRHVASVVPMNRTVPGDVGVPEAVESSQVDWPNQPLGAGVRVAVGDTGIAERPEFWGSVIADPDSRVAAGSEPPAVVGHGTFVTGLVLQQAPQATVRALKVLNAPSVTDSWEVATDLVRLAGERVDILNLSLGCHTDDDQAPLVFTRLLERLGPDVLVVAAAGNFAEGETRKALWPAAFEDVVAVGATDAEGSRPDWSPDPERSPWVDVQALGEGLVSTYLEGKVATEYSADGRPNKLLDFHGYGRWSGTSFAAARVTGMIAAATDHGHVSAREALATLVAQASRRGPRPWLG